MAQFSTKERLIASILSSTPRLKEIIKKVYVSLNYVLHRKGYRSKVIDVPAEIQTINPINQGDETFFGYYDKSPENDCGLVIFNETPIHTAKKPSSDTSLKINIFNRNTNSIINIGETLSYTWQQGCRAQWISNNRLIYNFFDIGHYKSAIYDMSESKIVKCYEYPVQDTFGEEFFLSINYARIMNLRPDYGYRNLPRLTDEEIDRTDNDGIWQIDYKTGDVNLIISLETLSKFQPKPSFKGAQHKVNHVMISPDGKSFIFIHRWYVGKRRYDRLVYSNFSSLKILAAEDMVSHMCWVNDNTLFGYLRHNGENGFFFINVATEEYTRCSALSVLGNGDGHPSVWKDWIVIDTYPDKSRLQHLYLYNMITDKVFPIAEAFQGISFQGESRCDMHPRFSPNGERVYFDTVFSGRRRLAVIDISSITNNY